MFKKKIFALLAVGIMTLTFASSALAGFEREDFFNNGFNPFFHAGFDDGFFNDRFFFDNGFNEDHFFDEDFED